MECRRHTSENGDTIKKKIMINFKQYNELLSERSFDTSCSDVCKDFINFCKTKLKLSDNINVVFTSKDDAEMTTGSYDPNTGQIKILTKDRALVDVLRSLAHELVHMHQDINGMLTPTSGETGSPHENQANSLAGVLMRLYTKDNREEIY